MGRRADLLRIVTIDILSGNVTHQYAYLLTTGTGVSEICALNDHEFLVDERDGKGRGETSNNAKVKQLFKIDLTDAVDVSAMDGPPHRRTQLPKHYSWISFQCWRAKRHRRQGHSVQDRGCCLRSGYQDGGTTVAYPLDSQRQRLPRDHN